MRAKKTSFWLLLTEANPDIIIGSETWLHQGIFEREVLPPGYSIIARRDRKQDHHGGVVIAAKDNIEGCMINLNTQAEFTAASFTCVGKEPLIIGSLYRPPNSDHTYMEELCHQIKDLQQTYPRSTIWIAGDANLPDINWDKYTISGSNYKHSISQLLLDTMYDVCSEQIVKFPTRGNNTLDIFLTNRPSLIYKCKPMPGVSDHDIVFVEAKVLTPRKKRPQRKIHLWKRADLGKMKEETETFSADFTDHHTIDTNINKLWDTFRTFCTETMAANVPSKTTSSRFSQPWINQNIKRLSRRKKRAYRRARASQDTKDKERYMELQKQTHQEVKRAYNNYINDMVNPETGTNPKKLYSFINSKRCDSSGVTLLKKDGISHSDPMTKASILNDQFSSVYTNEDLTTVPTVAGSPSPPMADFSIDSKGVLKILRDLNPHKAQGPDNIPPQLLKECAHEITPALTLLFQASLHQGSVPDDWKQAIITPVYKKGDKSAPANYRPISLTSVCCKVMEHVIHSQAMRHLDKHGILSDQQHGFRKKRSCESQLILTIQDLAAGLDDGSQIDAVLLDFSKAFDKVPHHRLLLKLRHYGIHGNTLRWIESFLSNRTQQVVVEGETSPIAPVTSGVPQGTVLGPLLFLVYINDLPQSVSSIARLFADDSLLYRRIRSALDTTIIQQDLNKLQQWENDWQMSFNPSKCEVIRISRKRNPIKATYHIHGHDLATVKTGKYLGVSISDNLTWNAHIDDKTKKANNTLGFLRRNIARCPKTIKHQCYTSLVRPIVEYASAVWDPHTSKNITQLEAVQRRAARFVVGDYRTTSSTSQMIADLGWQPLEQRRSDARLSMMFRITRGLIDICADPYLRPVTTATRGQSSRFLLPFCRTDAYRHSFFPAGIRLWNSLPDDVANSATLEDFKAGLARHY